MSASEAACPFGIALPAGRYGAPSAAPVRIIARRYSLVRLSARRGRSDALADAMRTVFGLDLPVAGRAGASGELTALWIQPSAWLLLGPPGEPGALHRSVKDACGASGSVVDQTQGCAVLHLSGERTRDVLGRICRLDLHPRAFRPGCVAATPVAELGCVVYQRDDGFELIVPASYAGWFAEAVRAAAAGGGYEIKLDA